MRVDLRSRREDLHGRKFLILAHRNHSLKSLKGGGVI